MTLSVRLRLEALEDRRVPSTFTVTTVADSGPGSLRQAILDANRDGTASTITFDVQGQITLASPLPTIMEPITVDGSGQELSGSGGTGLSLFAHGEVHGLTLDGFTTGILLEDAQSVVQHVRALGNGVGIQADGGASQILDNVVKGNSVGISVTLPNNVIQGNRVVHNGDGIRLEEEGSGNVVSDNTVLRNSGDGIYNELRYTTITGNRVEHNGGNGIDIHGLVGQDTVAGNTIDGNGWDGVAVQQVNQVMILGNAISGNGNRGIELIDGANQGQAAPVLDRAVVHGDNTVITGSLTSTPDATFTLEFYGDGGAVLLGTATVTTDDSGYSAFRVSVNTTSSGDSIVATATGDGGTSEFAEPVVASFRLKSQDQ